MYMVRMTETSDEVANVRVYIQKTQKCVYCIKQGRWGKVKFLVMKYPTVLQAL